MKARREVVLFLVAAGLLAGACGEGDDHVALDDDTSYVPEPFGPDNTWWHADAADVPDDLVGTGWDVGDVAPDFTLLDQFGDEVQLYQFYGQVIVLDIFAFG